MAEVPKVRVFVSSTWLDLQPERTALEAVLHRMQGIEYAGMEHFGARPASAQAVSLEEVRASDVYIGVFGPRYGSGITEDEYRQAKSRDLPCLIYRKAAAAISEAQRDADASKRARLESFLDEVCDSYTGHLAPEFSTPDQLAAAVSADLHSWLVSQYFPRVQQSLLSGVAELPIDYSGRISNFLAQYTGATGGGPVPFGGRAGTLRALDKWLDSETAPPYLLLAADAGRGKSAVLVHWTRELLARESHDVVFFPVSIRFRTNLASVTFPSLAARLARIHGEKVPQHTDGSVELWRGLVSEYLRRPVPDGRRIVVVLDGLDEAADWQAGADLFPGNPPPGLRVVVSGRHTVEAPDADSWLVQLGWKQTRLGQSLPLEVLSKAGVVDVLANMGFPLEELSRDIDVVTELYRLSSGDPLLVRLYVDDLWAYGSEASRLAAADLARLDPGLDGYFDRWWKDQSALWGDSKPLKERSVRDLLTLLSGAFGPLSRDDLLELASQDSGLDSWTLEDALAPLSRFVTGDHNGYVFSHPRFGIHLHAKLASKEKQAVETRFVKWGQSVLASLESGELEPLASPPYVVQYFGGHLERCSPDPQALLALVSESWKRAWLALEGGYSGFVNDVQRAGRCLARLNREDVARGGAPLRLGDEAYCALVCASVRSLARKIPANMVERLVEEKIWEPSQGLAYARQMRRPDERAKALGRVAQFLEGTHRSQVEADALACALEAPGSKCAEALVDLIATSASPPVSQLLGVAKTLDDYDKANRLSAAAISLARRDYSDPLEEVLAECSQLTGYARERLAKHLFDLGYDTQAEKLADELVSTAFAAWLISRGGAAIADRLLAARTYLTAADKALREVANRFKDLLELPVVTGADIRPLLDLVFSTSLATHNQEALLALLGKLKPSVSADVAAGFKDPDYFRESLQVHFERGNFFALLSILAGGSVRANLVARFLDEAEACSMSDRVGLLEANAPVLNSGLTNRLVDLLSDASVYDRKRVAQALARYGQCEAAVALLSSQEPGDRLASVPDLVGELAPDARREIVDSIARDLQASMIKVETASVLEKIAPHLDRPHLIEFLEIAGRIGDEPFAATARIGLAPETAVFGETERFLALWREYRATAGTEADSLFSVATILCRGVVGEELLRMVAAQVEVEQYGAIALSCVKTLDPISDLAPQARASLEEAAFSYLRGLPPEEIFSTLRFSELVIPERIRGQFDVDALRQALDELEGYQRSMSESDLVALLPRPEAEAQARRLIASGGFSANELARALAVLTPGEVDVQVSHWLRELSGEPLAKAIAITTPYMSAAQAQSIDVDVLFDEPGQRSLVLLTLLPLLAPEAASEAVARLCSDPLLSVWLGQIGKVTQHQLSRSLGVVGRELSPKGLESLLAASSQCRHDEAHFSVLRGLARDLVSLDHNVVFAILQLSLAPARSCEREPLIIELAVSAPLLDKLGGDEALRDAQDAIERAGALFP